MLIATGTSQSSIHDAVHDACNNRSCRFDAIARVPEPDATELTETRPLARTAQQQPGQLGDATKQPAKPLRGRPAQPQPPCEGLGCSHSNPGSRGCNQAANKLRPLNNRALIRRSAWLLTLGIYACLGSRWDNLRTCASAGDDVCWSAP